MAAVTEQFIRASDNQVKLTLTEDGVAISGAWTQLDIWIGTVKLTRASDGNGITLSTSTGILTINPGDLQAGEQTSLAVLEGGRYRVQILVTSSTNDDGALFGGEGAERIYFNVSDKPV